MVCKASALFMIYIYLTRILVSSQGILVSNTRVLITWVLPCSWAVPYIRYHFYTIMHIFYQINYNNKTSLASMQNFSKVEAIITIRHSNNDKMFVLPPIECCRLHSFCYNRMAYFHVKHETKLKCKQNVALYNPHNLNDTHHSEC